MGETEIYIAMVCSEKGQRYYVDYPQGRLHILNAKSLDWNLKKVFSMNSSQRQQVFEYLSMHGHVKVLIEQAKVA